MNETKPNKPEQVNVLQQLDKKNDELDIHNSLWYADYNKDIYNIKNSENGTELAKYVQ